MTDDKFFDELLLRESKEFHVWLLHYDILLWSLLVIRANDTIELFFFFFTVLILKLSDYFHFYLHSITSHCYCFIYFDIEYSLKEKKEKTRFF